LIGISRAWSAPELINYQGRLTDSAGQPLDGVTADLTFTFYGVETGSTPTYLTVLQEDVVVTKGIYNLLIGSGTVTPGVESGLADVFQKHQDVWMGVKVDSDQEMTPRERITSVPFAINAAHVDPSYIGDIIGNPDWDGDGYLKTGNTVDCNDGNPAINPGASEVCDNAIDNDCDGLIYGNDPDCLWSGTGSPMALMPSGCFNMGDAFSEGGSQEIPVHNVCITSDFYMDIHEVTNAEYAACVSGGGCTAPSNSSSYTRASYYGNPAYDDYPVIFVSWSQANGYCTWAGKRLPTEAEMEYAARGGMEGKRYFNGDSISCADADYGRWDPGFPCWNYGGLDNDTHPVGSYNPNKYGLYDVTGNVMEWLNDWYLDTYYSISPTNDPAGPASGTTRVLRGGCWGHSEYNVRVSQRGGSDPAGMYNSVGFRCARD